MFVWEGIVLCVGRVFDGGQRVCAVSSHWKPLAEVLHGTGIELCTLGIQTGAIVRAHGEKPVSRSFK